MTAHFYHRSALIEYLFQTLLDNFVKSQFGTVVLPLSELIGPFLIGQPGVACHKNVFLKFGR